MYSKYPKFLKQEGSGKKNKICKQKKIFFSCVLCLLLIANLSLQSTVGLKSIPMKCLFSGMYKILPD